jgi:aryl-alcohol dehydrogenase-like predicted oxidoreductase
MPNAVLDSRFTILKRTRLGNSDLEISRIVFGSMGRRRSSREERIRVIHAAVDAGTTTIDTAPLYDFGDVETVLGTAISDRRDRVEILSKVGLRWDDEHGEILFEFDDENGDRRAVRRDSRPAAIRKDVEASLMRLGTDRIDLCQIHHPDPMVPIAESLGELDRLVDEGKILHFGVSNFSDRELSHAIEASSRLATRRPLLSDQLHFSLLTQNQAAEILPIARQHGIGLLAYSPLEAGALTEAMLEPGNLEATARNRSIHFRPENARAIRSALHEAIEPVAERHRASVAQISLAWLLHQENVDGVIAGASRVDQAVAHAAASELALEPEEVESVGRSLSAVRIDPMAGMDWRGRVSHLGGRVRRKLGRVLRGQG